MRAASISAFGAGSLRPGAVRGPQNLVEEAFASQLDAQVETLETAEQAPLTVLRCAEIAQQVLPPGVFNVISGFGEEAGRPLAEHPLVRKVTFTGSWTVGREIAGYIAGKLCPVTLELGGKNPNIIMADADLEQAIPGVVHGMRFTRQGQSCTSGSRSCCTAPRVSSSACGQRCWR